MSTPPLHLLAGLDPQAVAEILARMTRRRFEAEQHVCRQGDAGDSLYLVMDGLVEVWLEEGERELIARLRPGDAVGEMSLLTGEPRAASIVTAVPTEILELDARTFAGVLVEHPVVLRNVALTLIERQKLANEQILLRRERGEVAAVVMGEGTADLAGHGVDAARQASPHEVALIDMTGKVRASASVAAASIVAPSIVVDRVADVLTSLDRLLAAHRTVLITVDRRQADLHLLLRGADRAVYLLAEAEARRLRTCIETAHAAAEWIRIGGHEGTAISGQKPLRAISLPAAERDRRWLGRHLSRTKLGLALGAGGAKAYAHVGALDVLEDAGYEVDYVSGASFGAIAGSCIAMGMEASQVRRQLDHLLSLEVCGPYFRLVTETKAGPQVFYRALSELAGERACEGLSVPLGILTADLNAQQPHAFVEGPLAEALQAALAIPGLAPPYRLGNCRLIDGVTISPVPVQLVRQLGADITVAVNLMSRDHLDTWPHAGRPGPAPARQPSHHLDPVVETIIMLQTDTSVRNADAADVTITPRFAPSSWRDIHLGKLFEEAGREAAQGQLSKLQSLARPLG